MTKLFGNQMLRLGGVLVLGLVLGAWLWGGGSSEHVHDTSTTDASVWTCSMHPQIRQSGPGQCPICGMDLIPVNETGSSGQTKSPYVHEMSAEAVALANVQTTTVVYQTPETSVALTGKIAVDEQRLRVITAHYAGRIEQLYVDFTGQWVQKGHKLASVYSPELITAQQELLETAKNRATNAVLYAAAREKLKLWKITDAQMDLLEKTGEIVTAFDVYADVSGIVLNRKVTKGDHVSRGSALFEIADLREVWVVVDAYERDLPWIRVGSQMNFTVPSLPGKTFTSTVTFIDPVIKAKTRTASVRAEAKNADLDLKLDMFVNAQIKSSVSQASLLIPQSAVLWTGKRSIVYVDVSTAQAPAFEMREVVLGQRMGENYLVTSGLKDGDVVVTHGVFAVDAAAQLSGNYSMMNRPQNKQVAVPKAFQMQLKDVGETYFQLKNALVQDDPVAVQKQARLLMQALNAVTVQALSHKAQEIWMPHRKILKQAGEAVALTSDIAVQREHFEALSNTMRELVERFRFFSKEAHIVYCPMAFENKGASWVSEKKEVANPYFGQSMLTCGEVKNTIAPLEAGAAVQRTMQGHQH